MLDAGRIDVSEECEALVDVADEALLAANGLAGAQLEQVGHDALRLAVAAAVCEHLLEAMARVRVGVQELEELGDERRLDEERRGALYGLAHVHHLLFDARRGGRRGPDERNRGRLDERALRARQRPSRLFLVFGHQFGRRFVRRISQINNWLRLLLLLCGSFLWDNNVAGAAILKPFDARQAAQVER